MNIDAEDITFLLWCAVKVLLASIIIPAIPSLFNFYIPLIACWISYFVLGALLLAYLESNKQYYIIPMKWKKSDLYFQLSASSRDLFVVLPTVIFLTHKFNIVKIVLTNPEEIYSFYTSPTSWLMVPGAIIVGLVWRMTIHRILHHPSIYRIWHKRHHVRPERMTPFSSFNDHPVEFLIMEAVGTFYIPVILNPLPMPVLVLVWSWQCFSGICDHTNATIPGSYFVDAEYHFTHHQLTVYNYAEFEILDKLAGTLYIGDAKERDREGKFDSIDTDMKAGSFDIVGFTKHICSLVFSNKGEDSKQA